MSETGKNVILNVEGMTCTNCAMGITRSLEQKGLQNVNSDFSAGEVSFDIIMEEDLKKAAETIKGLGYKVIENNPGEKKKPERFSLIEKKFFFCLAFTLPLFLHMFLPHTHFLNNPYVQLALCLPVFAAGLIHFGKSAWGSLKSRVPNMDVLITIGTSAAFIYSIVGTINNLGHDYLFYETSATIITLVLLGNLLEQKSVRQTTTAIGELSRMQPSFARIIILRDGKENITDIEISKVKIGDILAVNTGDKIPVDGIIISGNATIDESMITGESIPAEKEENDIVTGGTLILEGSVKMMARKVGNETMLSQIIEMVKKAQQERPEIQKLGDKVSAIFVPAVISVAIITFISWYFIFDSTFRDAIMNSVAVLVISCPCAMGLATPTAVMVGIGRAAKSGILIKGGSTIELLSKIKNIVFDKTGTLTTGNFKIREIVIANEEPEKNIKDLIYSIEKHSSHPIAKSLVSELNGSSNTIVLIDVKEEKGQGISARDSNGNSYFIGSYSAVKHLTDENNFTSYLLKNDKVIAKISIEDEIKPQAAETLSQLHEDKIKTYLLSGDKKEKCEVLCEKLNIDEFFCEQKPGEKLQIIEELSEKNSTAMVGDGINDAPALAKATVGISLGNASQAAIQSAQIIILNGNNLLKINEALKISKHTYLTIKQNLFWAFFYNIVAIPIAAAGLLNPMVGALAMAFSDVIVVGNSLRLKTKKIK